MQNANKDNFLIKFVFMNCFAAFLTTLGMKMCDIIIIILKKAVSERWCKDSSSD